VASRELTLVLDGLGFGEGLRWRDDRLWFSDFLEHRVSSIGPNGDLRVEAELDDRPSGIGWLPDGRLLVVSMHRRTVLRREPDGALVIHADLAPVATSHANDMVVAADGTAYVGNFGFDVFGGSSRANAQLAIVRPDGTVLGGPTDLEFPKGTVIMPDGRTLIVGESFARRYRAFLIAADGTLGTGRRRRGNLVRERARPRSRPCEGRRSGRGGDQHTGWLLCLRARRDRRAEVVRRHRRNDADLRRAARHRTALGCRRRRTPRRSAMICSNEPDRGARAWAR
jgi:sugar lactone lactonase YvrE